MEQIEAAKIETEPDNRATYAKGAHRRCANTRARKSEPTDLEDDPPFGPDPLSLNRIPVDQQGSPKDSAQRNFADADSRIMKDKVGFTQG